MLWSGRSDLEELNKEIAGAQVVRDVVQCHLDNIVIDKVPTRVDLNIFQEQEIQMNEKGRE